MWRALLLKTPQTQFRSDQYISPLRIPNRNQCNRLDIYAHFHPNLVRIQESFKGPHSTDTFTL
ncbi:Uncharacterised protein [Vibrio cholerae]|nr:Uncharacterised protein [Vibrio cholerae]CSD70580.1 Uncharacterised protein [Vibrio cholerae]CSI65877.1 Uncharacterised protein [Vibrio cholerae]